jgi:hypothetical protein
MQQIGSSRGAIAVIEDEMKIGKGVGHLTAALRPSEPHKVVGLLSDWCSDDEIQMSSHPADVPRIQTGDVAGGGASGDGLNDVVSVPVPRARQHSHFDNRSTACAPTSGEPLVLDGRILILLIQHDEVIGALRTGGRRGRIGTEHRNRLHHAENDKIRSAN